MNKSSIIITVRSLANEAAIAMRYSRLFTSDAAIHSILGEAKAYRHAAKMLVCHAKILGVWGK